MVERIAGHRIDAGLESRLTDIERKIRQGGGGSTGDFVVQNGKPYYRWNGKLIPLSGGTTTEVRSLNDAAMAKANEALALAQTHATRHRLGGADQLFDQNLDTTSAVTFADATVSSLTANRLLVADANKKIASAASLTGYIAGTANRVTVTDDGDGTVTLSGPQDIHTAATPTFAAMTLNGASDAVKQTIQGASGQTANLQEYRDNTNKLLSRMNALGEWYTTDSGTEINSALLSSPTVNLYVAGSETVGINTAGVCSATSASSRMVFGGTRCRGTLSSPTAAVSGDSVVSLLGNVYDGGALRATGAITMIIESAVSSGVAPLYMSFQTGVGTATGSPPRAERMRITSTGEIRIADAGNLAFGTSTGTKIGTATNQKIGFFNATPVVQRSAYTQTYSTASRTHANSTFVSPAVGATRDLECRAALDQLAADVVNLKQVLNSVIDDQQALGLVG